MKKLFIIFFHLFVVSIPVCRSQSVPQPIEQAPSTDVTIGFLALIIVFILSRYQEYIREIKKLKNSLRAKDMRIQEDSRKLNQLRGVTSRFLTNVSHEFKTPITTIILAVSKLVRSDLQSNNAHDFKTIKRNADKLLGLVNQLIDLSQLKNQNVQLELQRTDISALAHTLTKDFAAFAADKAISVSFNKVEISKAKPQDAVWAQIDPAKIVSVISHLLSNAIKFNVTGGTIAIELSQSFSILESKPDSVSINIENTGPPIPAECVPYIFDEFYQAEMTDDRSHEGSGIGLAIVREYIRLHSGTIAVSREALITKFHLRIPLVQTSFPASQERRTEKEFIDDIAIPTGVKVLIADRNDALRLLIKKMVEPHATVIDAASGLHALELFHEFRPDILVADVFLDHMDGFSLAKAVRADQTTVEIPIILMSSTPQVQERLDVLHIGASEYLAKPFQARDLLIRISNLITRATSTHV